MHLLRTPVIIGLVLRTPVYVRDKIHRATAAAPAAAPATALTAAPTADPRIHGSISFTKLPYN